MDQEKETTRAICNVVERCLPKANRGTKWNAPSFSVNGQDLITLNYSRKNIVRIVFHRGAKATDTRTGTRLINDASGLLTWATDQRAYVSFPDAASVAQNAERLAGICQAWVAATRV